MTAGLAYGSKFKLGPIGLYVNDLVKVSQFYQKVLGMVVISESPSQVSLGIKQNQVVLLDLIQTDDSTLVKSTYGLYHVAFLLPSRVDLGHFLKEVQENNVHLIGTADHGYSEAIYLEDDEGNGIEIYWDKPTSQWDIQSDGRIKGITKPIDETGILASALHRSGPFELPVGTAIGHVHLSVPKASSASSYWQNNLAIQVKYEIISAAWLASGNYHHHLAVNHWAGPDLMKRQVAMPGLAYFSLTYPQVDDFNQLLNRLRQDKQTQVISQTNQTVIFESPEGIRVRACLAVDEVL